MSDSVSTEDHRGETACDDREKKTRCDSVLHSEGPKAKSPLSHQQPDEETGPH